jgi:predicted amidohydrolase
VRYSGFAFLFLAAAASVSAAPPDVQAKTVKPAPHNPIVRVVTISQDRLRRASPELLDDTIERLDNAATFRPDIVCLPELFSDQPPESATGQVSARVAQWARAHSSYVVFGLKTRAGNRTYNSAVLVDRHGDVVGSYNKIHPTENELRDGTTPGDDDPQVFETDFGPIGIQICFDINWWDNWKRLKAKGAQIVFFPSAFPAAHQLSALALMNQFFVVSSPQSGTARIYDVSGETLSASGRYQPWAGAVLPLGRRLFEIDYHAQKVREIQQKYGQKVQVVWYHEDDWFTLASLDPNLNVNDLISEFGLTPLNDYRLRATAAVNDARARAASSR